MIRCKSVSLPKRVRECQSYFSIDEGTHTPSKIHKDSQIYKASFPLAWLTSSAGLPLSMIFVWVLLPGRWCDYYNRLCNMQLLCTKRWCLFLKHIEITYRNLFILFWFLPSSLLLLLFILLLLTLLLLLPLFFNSCWYLFFRFSLLSAQKSPYSGLNANPICFMIESHTLVLTKQRVPVVEGLFARFSLLNNLPEAEPFEYQWLNRITSSLDSALMT